MTRRHQLETSLKSLALSGMLDTLEARLAQTHAVGDHQISRSAINESRVELSR